MEISNMSRIMDIIKQVKEEGRDKLTAVTHSGRFHLDELLALSMVVTVANEHDMHITIRRTRRPEIMEISDLVLDVGYLNEGKYLDHHDAYFNEYHKDTGIKMATTGLVWNDLQEEILNWATKDIDTTIRDRVKELVAEITFTKIILPTDMMDNGQSKGNWNVSMSFEEIVCSYNDSEENSDEQFMKAFELVLQIFHNKMRDIVKTAEDDDIVVQSYHTADPVLSNQGILILPRGCNWISSIKRHWDDTRHLKVCIYPDDSAPDIWKIQTLPGDKYSRYDQRCSSPEFIKGFNRNNAHNFPEFPHKENLVFVHANGFLGSLQGSFDDALSFAQWWVENSSTPPYVVPTEQEYIDEWNTATIISRPDTD